MSLKFDEFDKDKITEALSQNTSLDKSQLNTYADTIENAIGKAKNTIEENDLNTIKADAKKNRGKFLQ